MWGPLWRRWAWALLLGGAAPAFAQFDALSDFPALKPHISGQTPAVPPFSFLAGVNYPWFNYGTDFGGNAWGHRGVSSAQTRAAVAADFFFLRSKGVKAARWFLFCDGRAGLAYDSDGRVTGLDPYVFPDLDAAVSIAQDNGIQLILVLFDFHLLDDPRMVGGVQMGGRTNLVRDPQAAGSLFSNALEPLLRRYGHHPAILAWEIMNEPEWRRDGAIPGFAKRLADLVHAQTGQMVTLGSNKRAAMGQWRDVGLDFYQYHDYPDLFLLQELDKPCLLGEFPTNGGGRALRGYLDGARQQGLAGALAWSYRATDRYSNFKAVADDFSSWVQAHAP